MNNITIYDLLELIKNGKPPKKIRYNNMTYHINIDYGDYESDIEDYRFGDCKEHYYLFEDINIFTYGQERIEILDNENTFITMEEEEWTKITDETISGLCKSLNVLLKEQNTQINQLIHNQKIIFNKIERKE